MNVKILSLEREFNKMKKNNKKQTKKKFLQAMTFLEVIIAIGIFSALMLGIAMLVAKSWSGYHQIMDTGSSSLNIKQGIDQVVDTIRKARNSDNGYYPIKSVGSSDLVIFSDVDKDGITERVHYYINGGNLIMGVTKPTGSPPSYPDGDNTTKTLVGNILNDASQPIFRYYDGSNNEIASPATNLPNIRMVKVSLIIGAGVAKNITEESYASFRNLNEHDTIQ